MAKKSSGSSRRARQQRVSTRSMYDIAPKMGRKLKTLSGKPDAEIDLSDIPEIADWSQAVVGKFYRPIR